MRCLLEHQLSMKLLVVAKQIKSFLKPTILEAVPIAIGIEEFFSIKWFSDFEDGKKALWDKKQSFRYDYL